MNITQNGALLGIRQFCNERLQTQANIESYNF